MTTVPLLTQTPPATRNRASDEKRRRMSRRDFDLTSPGILFDPSRGPPRRQWRAPRRLRERPRMAPRGAQEESKRSHARWLSRDFFLTPAGGPGRPREGPKMAPRGARRRAQEGPRGEYNQSLELYPIGALSAPRRLQEGSKRGPGRPAGYQSVELYTPLAPSPLGPLLEPS